MILFLVSFLGNIVIAGAQDNKGTAITTSPISADIVVIPGTSGNTTLQVQNNTPNPLNISIKLAEFKANGNKGDAQIYYPNKNDPSLSYVHFSQNVFLAQPNVWNQITMTVNLPASAQLGYYYAVIFSPNTINTEKANTKLKGANAIFVLVDSHSANEANKIEIAKFSVEKSVYQFLPVNIDVDIRNVGNIFTIPSGNLYISRAPNGPSITTLDLNPGLGNVLPNSDRVFTQTWSDGFPVFQKKKINGQVVTDKKAKPIYQLRWDFSKLSKFRFGKYYASLVVFYNNGVVSIPIHANLSFWVIPWWIILSLTLITALMMLGIFTIMRSVYRRVRGNKKSK